MSLTEIPNGWSYSPPVENRTYTPPTPPPQFVAPQVTAAAVQVEGTALQQANAVMVHAHDERQKHIDRTNQDRHLY
jgi:hypothetical protein